MDDNPTMKINRCMPTAVVTYKSSLFLNIGNESFTEIIFLIFFPSCSSAAIRAPLPLFSLYWQILKIQRWLMTIIINFYRTHKNHCSVWQSKNAQDLHLVIVSLLSVIKKT